MIGFFPLLLESAPNPIPLIALGVFLVLSLFHSVLLYQLQLHTDLPPSLLPNYSSYFYLIHHLTFQIRPCTKRPTRTRDDSHRQRRFLIQPQPNFLELLREFGIDAVQIFGFV